MSCVTDAHKKSGKLVLNAKKKGKKKCLAFVSVLIKIIFISKQKIFY